MPALQPLHSEHAPALLAFELENRAYFARTISDRGDDYFARFEERLAELLKEQAEGTCFFHVLVGDGGEVLGRINLVDAADGCAELGYRIAERAAGQGLATAGVREVCGLAARRYGLTALRAETTVDNAGSRAVLGRTGFVTVGEAVVDGQTRILYRLDLSAFA